MLNKQVAIIALQRQPRRQRHRQTESEREREREREREEREREGRKRGREGEHEEYNGDRLKQINRAVRQVVFLKLRKQKKKVQKIFTFINANKEITRRERGFPHPQFPLYLELVRLRLKLKAI